MEISKISGGNKCEPITLGNRKAVIIGNRKAINKWWFPIVWPATGLVGGLFTFALLKFIFQ